jgi:colanic acid/amylovoran biosynthesis glycosyltransferase
MNLPSGAPAVALHRCDAFVGRTMNWLYDHLRAVPRYTPLVVCDRLENRTEFPEVEAWRLPREGVLRRAWYAAMGDRLYPADARRVRSHRPRVLHSHFGYVAIGDHALHRAIDVPWIAAFYGVDVYEIGKRPRVQARYAALFREATAVLALGPVMAAALEELGCPREKIVVHALGVDTSAIPSATRTRRGDQELSILFAGTFREKKGIEYAIEAAAMLRDAGVRFRLHLAGDTAARRGDQETKAAVFRLIAARNLADHTVHHSWLPFKDLLALAMSCHVFVAPSVTASDGDAEGTPFVVQQMMATGMPVVATTHSDVPFVFGNCATMLVPERDAGAIADRLRRYFDEPERLATDGRRMLDQVRAHFDVKARAAALADLYDRLA